ncbi:MAG: methyltransferase domain-containing protein [Acidimicrobiia bacterium]|nr:methyltransferase domain-containing protein [Acidimicrobiia bacterium]
MAPPATNCSFSEGVAEALDAPDDSFDVVVSSLMVHHLPDALRTRAIEMFRVVRPGGSVLVAEFRPPRSRLGRYLISPLASTAMRHNPIHLLGPMLQDAGFRQAQRGDLHPWVHYVRAAKPTPAS